MYRDGFIYLPTCLPAYLPIYSSTHRSIYPSTIPSIYPSTVPSIYLSISIYLSLSIYLSIYLSLSLYLSIYLPFCQPFNPFVHLLPISLFTKASLLAGVSFALAHKLGADAAVGSLGVEGHPVRWTVGGYLTVSR